MSKEELIRSIPRLQKQAEELKQFRDMQKDFTQNPLGRYLLRATGVNV